MPDEQDRNQIDWSNLPNEAEVVGLWPCLHDGDLVAIQSDLKQRTLLLRFDVDYVREFNGLPEGVTFEFRFSGVGSVRSVQYKGWQNPSRTGLPSSAEEWAAYRAEAARTVREESGDWRMFEWSVAQGSKAEIENAELVVGKAGIALRLFFTFESPCDRAFIRAEALDIRTSDGINRTVQEYLAMGKAYWDDFAKRSLARRKRNVH